LKPAHITSRDNLLLRRARAVRDGKAPESIFIEGLRLCEEAFDSNLPIEALIYSEHLARKERAAALIERIQNTGARWASVSEKLLDSISYTKTPQGIVMLARRPSCDVEAFHRKQSARPLLVILHGVNNPVNVGAVIRTAEAAGVTGIVATKSTSDPFSAKALRGAMGSAFRIPIWCPAGYAESIEWCNQHRIKTYAADPSAVTTFDKADWKRASALIVGSESAGLSEKEMRATHDTVAIPMHGKIESLNVAVAAGVILYEAARQRR
jgi:TrmH family RNA methyltransferase